MNAPIVMAIFGLVTIGSVVVLLTGDLEDHRIEESVGTLPLTSGDIQESEALGSPGAVSNEEAYANIEAYLDRNPRDIRRACQYGDALLGLTEFERAEGFYLEQIRLHPRIVELHSGLGRCYQKTGQWSKAVSAYSRALEIDYRHQLAKKNLAWILATSPVGSLRDGPRAVTLAQHAIEDQAAPAPSIMATLAAGHAEMGNFKKAIEAQDYVITYTKSEKRRALAIERKRLYRQKKPLRISIASAR